MAQQVIRKLLLPLSKPDGSAPVNTTVKAFLVDATGTQQAFDVTTVDGITIPSLVVATPNSSGVATLELWPNARGVRATKYRIQVVEGSKVVVNVLTSIPDGDASVVLTLPEVITLTNLPPLSEVEALARDIQLAQIQVAEDRVAVAADRELVQQIAESIGGGGGGGPLRYTHDQSSPALVWTIAHNLNRKPTVVVTDRLGNVLLADTRYVDSNIAQVTHGVAINGYAYCN